MISSLNPPIFLRYHIPSCITCGYQYILMVLGYFAFSTQYIWYCLENETSLIQTLFLVVEIPTFVISKLQWHVFSHNNRWILMTCTSPCEQFIDNLSVYCYAATRLFLQCQHRRMYVYCYLICVRRIAFHSTITFSQQNLTLNVSK